MFQAVGKLVARFWPFVLFFWAAALAALWVWAPPWEEVGKSGQFAYLPADTPTRRAEAVFDEAFPGQRIGSTVVLVVTRSDAGQLQESDLRFAREVLTPRLRQTLESSGVLLDVRGPEAGPVGTLLQSPDHKAALVIAELTSEFLDSKNWPVVTKVEGLLRGLQADGQIPNDIQVALTGSAVLGRDTGRAEADSAKAVQKWTIVAVVALLLIVYRAPLLALIPLVTVAVGVAAAQRLLALLGKEAHLNLYQGVTMFVTVVGYGAGVDYCLFVIARCREEWAGGASRTDGVRHAVAKVGPAVAASAATVACGIAMMGFAEFGKIRQAGLGIAFSLVIVFAAGMTLAPSLLCLTGRHAFWPRKADAGSTGAENFWEHVGRLIARRPGAIWITAFALMVPLAVVSLIKNRTISYDLTRNIPRDAPSAVGLRTLREHFPGGAISPVTVLLRNERVNFGSDEGSGAVGTLSGRLMEKAADLGLADIRSVAEPLGTGAAARESLASVPFAAGLVRSQALGRYVGASGYVTRLDVVLRDDPLAGPGLHHLSELEKAVQDNLPESLKADTQVYLLGSAAGMRDLEMVTRQDRRRVDVLVVAAVFVILLILLRGLALSAYLILTVVLGYLTTSGLTILVFAAAEGPSFPGLDWRVPFFLFTILVAVGEDYNIFLVSRVHEEEKVHGPSEGVIFALRKTGGVITSCGLIMAGTFASLFGGSLSELREMGFALCVGVLLDTLVVRPVLVPAFMLMWERWKPRPDAVS